MNWLFVVAIYLIVWVFGQTVLKFIVGNLPRAKALSFIFFLCAGIMFIYNFIFAELRFEKIFLVIIAVGLINACGATFRTKAYQYSLSKTNLFTPLAGVITITLAGLFLNEGALYNAGMILGVLLLFTASILLSKKGNQENDENPGMLWLLFILGMVLFEGFTIFMTKYFSFTVPQSTFLLYWYSGSFLGSLPIILLERNDQKKFFQKNMLWVPLASLGLLGSMAILYWAFQLAPAGVVDPIRRFGMSFLPIFIGWFVFKERKELTKIQIIGFILGIIGSSLVILNVYKP